MPNYEIEIQIDSTTVTDLTGYSLCAYKGANTSAPINPLSAACPVWFSTTAIGGDMKVSWEETYAAYISENQQLGQGVNISTSTYSNMSPQQMATAHNNGSLPITVDSTLGAGYYAITNGGDNVNKPPQAATQWVCGLAQAASGTGVPPGGEPAPFCAFPLYGAGDVVMEPYINVMLMFQAGTINTGTVYEESSTQSITIQLTSGMPSVVVAFDMTAGWSTVSPAINPGDPWAVANLATVSIAQTLLQTSTTLQKASEALKAKKK